MLSIWALVIGREKGDVKAYRDDLEHFFPWLPVAVRACQDGFFHICSFDRGGGGSEAIWAMPL